MKNKIKNPRRKPRSSSKSTTVQLERLVGRSDPPRNKALAEAEALFALKSEFPLAGRGYAT